MIVVEINKINYQNKLLELVRDFKDKPTLLLHSCCGPCSTQVIDFLKDYCEVVYLPRTNEISTTNIKRKLGLKK